MNKPRDKEYSHGEGEKVTLPGTADSPPGGEGELADTLPTSEQLDQDRKSSASNQNKGTDAQR